ncbi:MAG: iron chelate uptake ABC transporter family permease subunit [Planctomycetota bacterium]
MIDSWSAMLSTYQNAYLAAALIAVGCAVVGLYVVLGRISFVGIATAQISAAGVALAFLLHFWPLPAAILSALAGVSFFALVKKPKRVTGDATIGAAFAISTALAVLFVSRSGAELDQVEHIIYGTLLFTTSDQVQVLAVGVGVVLLIHALFAREFLMISFDPESARTLGVRTGFFNLLQYLSLGTIIALSISTAGSLLAFAFLILPPMIGLLVSERIVRVFVISILAALLTAFGGVLGAILFDVPTGPAIVVAAAVLLLSAAASRIHVAAGVGSLLTFAALTFFSLEGRVEPQTSGAATADTRIDLKLEVHDRKIRQGEDLHVDYVIRFSGPVPGNLHLLVDAGESMGVVKLLPAASRTAGQMLLETGPLAPGVYLLSASLWTGDPLEPDQETGMLPADVCSSNKVEIEIGP